MIKRVPVILLLIAFCIFLSFYYPVLADLPDDIVWGYYSLIDDLPVSQMSAEVDANDVYDEFQGMDAAYVGPLPWEKDTKFQNAVNKLGSPVLMAAYRATLKEPLPGEEYNISLAARKLAGTVVQPGQIFSQNKTLGPYTQRRGFRPGPTYKGTDLVTTIGGGVCKIASVLYNLATFSDLEVVQRFPHSMTVPYVPPGQDATVYYGVKDFRFKNTSSGPILIWSQEIDNALYIAFYGNRSSPKVTWHHQVLKRNKYWKEYKRNSSLSPGEEKVVLPGQDGFVVRSWVTVETDNGETIVRKKGVSYYSPGPEIIERAR